VGGSKLLGMDNLALATTGREQMLAREYPVGRLKFGAQDMLNAKVLGQRLGRKPGPRGQQGNDMPGLLVTSDRLLTLLTDPGGDLLVKPRPDLGLERGDRTPGVVDGRLGGDLLKVHPRHSIQGQPPKCPHQSPHGEPTSAPFVADPLGSRIDFNQRAVDIKECSDTLFFAGHLGTV